MFSGIVQELGIVKNISRRGRITLLELGSKLISSDAAIGESIAVNGCCLTLVKNQNSVLCFELVPETAKTTNLGSLRVADRVNLECSLRFGGKISGHFVSAHVDCCGVIRSKGYRLGNLAFEIAVPQEFNKYILPKGSVAVDGISLTAAGKKPGVFFVYIIPHTLKNTTLGFKGPSDKVNIEFDILAKSAAARVM